MSHYCGVSELTWTFSQEWTFNNSMMISIHNEFSVFRIFINEIFLTAFCFARIVVTISNFTAVKNCY